jgi:hypothetical protein
MVTLMKENAMSDLEKAEALISSLEQKRVAHVEKGVALADERASIACKVHADADPKAGAGSTRSTKKLLLIPPNTRVFVPR